PSGRPWFSPRPPPPARSPTSPSGRDPSRCPSRPTRIDYLPRRPDRPAAGAPAQRLGAWGAGRLAPTTHPEDPMAFSLPPLPYPTDALEPSIDKMTMEIHHGRHHKMYVDNLNAALEGQTALQAKPIDQLLREISSVPDGIRQKVVNNGGGHANHTMFWEIMGPKAGG